MADETSRPTSGIDIEEKIVRPDNSIDYDALRVGLAKLGNVYRENLEARYRYKVIIGDAEAQMKRIEAEIASLVANTMEPDGKKRYSNKDARDAEVTRQLTKNESYQNYLTVHHGNAKSLAELEANVAVIELKCRNYRAILESKESATDELRRDILAAMGAGR